LTVTELVRVAYRVGEGDPWAGYLEIKPKLVAEYPNARDVAAVVRSELGKMRTGRQGSASA
jgi:hypothetical protein